MKVGKSRTEICFTESLLNYMKISCLATGSIKLLANILKKHRINPKYISERIAEVLKNDYGIV